MKRTFVCLVAGMVAASMIVIGCASPASSPAPATGAAAKPAQPAKAAQPAKPQAAQPAAPVGAKIEYPPKGRPVNIVVAYAPGGSMDVGARILAPFLEKELSGNFQVVNRPEAAPQGGDTEVVRSKPDGTTISYMSTASILVYLDPDRKAVYGRKELQQVAMLVTDPDTFMVAANGPYKTMKDLVDAAKAKPGEVKIGTAGALGPNHMAILLFQKAAGVKFRAVHFNGAAPAATALLGGHIDALVVTAGSAAAHYKSGALRYVAIMDKAEHTLYPGVPTLESQGYKLYSATSRGIVVPTGTPKEIVDELRAALKKIANSEEYQQKMKAAGLPHAYLDGPEFATYWDQYETQVKPLYAEAKAELAKQ